MYRISSNRMHVLYSFQYFDSECIIQGCFVFEGDLYFLPTTCFIRGRILRNQLLPALSTLQSLRSIPYAQFYSTCKPKSFAITVTVRADPPTTSDMSSQIINRISDNYSPLCQLNFHNIQKPPFDKPLYNQLAMFDSYFRVTANHHRLTCQRGLVMEAVKPPPALGLRAVVPGPPAPDCPSMTQ